MYFQGKILCVETLLCGWGAVILEQCPPVVIVQYCCGNMKSSSPILVNNWYTVVNQYQRWAIYNILPVRYSSASYLELRFVCYLGFFFSWHIFQSCWFRALCLCVWTCARLYMCIAFVDFSAENLQCYSPPVGFTSQILPFVFSVWWKSSK